MSDADLKIRNIAGNLGTATFGYRFPDTLGSNSDDPDSKKFCLFRIRKRRAGNQKSENGYIALPIPELNDGVNVTYNQAEFGVSGAIAVGAASNIGGAGSVSDIGNILLGAVRGYNSTVVKRIAGEKALSAVPGIDSNGANAILQKGLGTIQNPYLSNVFDKVGFREFSFNFKLLPKNETEAQTIKNIVTQFKKSMLPQTVTQTNYGPRGEKIMKKLDGIQYLPDIFDITFFPTTKNYAQTESGNYLFRVEEAVMTSFGVEYSEGTANPTFFKDNVPMGVSLSMSFKETAIYTRERCENDYSTFLNTENFQSASAG